VAEVLLAFAEPIASEDGVMYVARACGAAVDHHFQGWLEFTEVNGTRVVRSARETTQPNREDLVYWATGLTKVYLEGALGRALTPVHRQTAAPTGTPAFDGPAPDFSTNGAPKADSVLNPLSVYRKGEALLRDQLAALSAWHLVNIIRAYELSAMRPDQLNRMPAPELIEVIVEQSRARVEALSR
jgi:hypothetical protein